MTEPVNIKAHKGEFFRILTETAHSQIGVMTIRPGGDSGAGDLHRGDQFIYVIEGEGQAEVGGQRFTLREGEAVIIPAGTPHRIYNTGASPMFFVTVYAPPSY